jgi:hypothetical protein
MGGGPAGSLLYRGSRSVKMHWHITHIHYNLGTKDRIATFWSLEAAWAEENRLDDLRQGSRLTVTECESLECLVEAFGA